MKSDPCLVKQLSGRVFEELVAELLASRGLEDISLRVHTGAGEVDILGFSQDLMGERIGYVFELKQRGQSGESVELREVTRLYGIRESLRQRLGLTQGILVTTTDYTPPARQAAAMHHLGLREYGDLVDWINEYRDAGSYLHLNMEGEAGGSGWKMLRGGSLARCVNELKAAQPSGCRTIAWAMEARGRKETRRLDHPELLAGPAGSPLGLRIVEEATNTSGQEAAS